MKSLCYTAWLLLLFVPVSDPVDSMAPSRTNGLIILMTDFGHRDFYVGAMKGAIYSVFPQARIDSISHSISKFNIKEGAYTLAKAASEFPSGTIFVAIVDPGSGTDRKPIALKTENGNYFFAPDNGLLTLVGQEMGVAEVREITNPSVMRQGTVSFTFQGRDIFGPAAAHVANGFPFEEIGAIVKTYVQLPPREFAKIVDGEIMGRIDIIDEYGNVITNIRRDLFRELGIQPGQTVEVEFESFFQRKIRCEYATAYGDVPVGEYVGLFNSGGVFEIAINQEDLASSLNLEVSGRVIVRKLAR